MNIESLLKERNLTKTAFAEMMGVRKQNVNGMFENPTLNTLKKVASTLNISLSELFDDSVCEEAKDSELVALISYKGVNYRADSIADLESLINEWKSETTEK